MFINKKLLSRLMKENGENVGITIISSVCNVHRYPNIIYIYINCIVII